MSQPATVEATSVLFTDRERRHKRIRELFALFDALATADTLSRRLDALERLARWVTVPDSRIPMPAPQDGAPAGPEVRRLAVLVTVLERTPALRTAVAARIAAVLGDTAALGLIAETGLPSDRGLMAETTDRFLARVLPSPRDEHQLSRLLLRLFPSARELTWLEGLPPDLFQRLVDALGTSGYEALVQASTDAFCLLGARLQALGLSEPLRVRGSGGALTSSPFFRLPRLGDAFLQLTSAPASRIAAEREWRLCAQACTDEVACVHEHLEATGISLDVVYALDLIVQILARMECLLGVLAVPSGPDRVVTARRLLVVLVRGRLADRSLRELARSNLRLLARKIIERAGRTGEHYIAYTRREYAQLMLSAAGGGLLTTGTALVKLVISMQRQPLFVEGFLSGVNYAFSFLLIQMLGFTLATKQPSMTGATLANAIGDSDHPSRLDELVTQVARICRSQLAAAFGNVSMVTAGAIGADLFWRWRTGHPILDPEKTQYVLQSLHPWASGTIFYAALTGVILWLSSLAAGWTENFVVYRRLPQAIAEHGLGRLLGRSRMQWLATAFAGNVSGWSGSIALGFMLGMCPIFGKFFGLPLDVRHVTLSTGTLALAAAERGLSVLHDPAFRWAALGIVIIFMLNLSVSFTLALAVALRARAVPLRTRVVFLSALFRRALRRPGQFILPPGRNEAAPARPHH